MYSLEHFITYFVIPNKICSKTVVKYDISQDTRMHYVPEYDS